MHTKNPDNRTSPETDSSTSKSDDTSFVSKLELRYTKLHAELDSYQSFQHLCCRSCKLAVQFKQIPRYSPQRYKPVFKLLFPDSLAVVLDCLCRDPSPSLSLSQRVVVFEKACDQVPRRGWKEKNRRRVALRRRNAMGVGDREEASRIEMGCPESCKLDVVN